MLFRDLSIGSIRLACSSGLARNTLRFLFISHIVLDILVWFEKHPERNEGDNAR